MGLNELEITKIDNILKFLVEHHNMRFDDDYAARKLNISEKEYNFLLDKIVDFSECTESILDVLERQGNWRPFRTNYSTERFIENGGFKGYFERLNNTEKQIDSIQNIINIHNSNVGDVLAGKEVTKTKENNNSNRQKTKSLLKHPLFLLFAGALISLLFWALKSGLKHNMKKEKSIEQLQTKTTVQEKGK